MAAPSLLSIVIPARNEEDSIAETITNLHRELHEHAINHEIVVVDDASTDGTARIVTEVAEQISEVRRVSNGGPHGFGHAVIYGLDHARGDAAVVMMGDQSDDCGDVVRYWQKLNEGFDCVFGSRFIAGGKAIDYPWIKLILNRAANRFLQVAFWIDCNDTTNAFKAYRRRAIDGCRPLLSGDFNLTVELPLKAIVRGFSWTVIPVTWRNRKHGVAKFRIREMGSHYLSACFHIWLEKYFGRRR